MRALAILRMRGGRKVPPQLLRMRADDLLAAVFPDQAACPENLTGPIRIPDHVLVRETIDNCLHEAMDLDGLLAVLREPRSRRDSHGRGRHAGAVGRSATRFSTPIRMRISTTRRSKSAARAPCSCGARPAATSTAPGILSADAIAEVAEESWPVVRDADELHDALGDAGRAAAGRAVERVVRRAGRAARRATTLSSPAGDVLDLRRAAGRSRKRRIPNATLDPHIDAVTHDAVAGRARGGGRRDPARLARVERAGDESRTGRSASASTSERSTLR